ncbi:MAG: glycosyltransferase family protein, partial [Candidatus Heimdallarchaeota archaeon]
MKVLYGINTNGQGHINRSRVFVNELMNDGHEVQVLFSG